MREVPKKKKDALPDYEAPEVVSYQESEIVDEISPAQACTSPE